ncbi:class I SAM-dependent RNA methyltransferase [Actinomyces lilanjuaniae]|uniref:Class I SAM-dependent RNA methyltransferase n=1 Tax=Actinomyces lilanjuaniae TaxID=2321394 RepID=A0ABM6Z6R7_9ACTO|nr:TRAM domain-containing protein [Actinomyces lilanjuaniae]AYD90877.1 class I SAM-dependent RNA methyltransferase [Actinomyces lilanjuaniae]
MVRLPEPAGRGWPSGTGKPGQSGPGDQEGEDLLLRVTAPAHGGHCVARPVDDPSGRVVFVRHTLPGETVRARVTQRTSRAWRAEVVEVLEPSPDRVSSVWPEAGPFGVGGGELAHVCLPAQRVWKQWVLADCLRRVGGPQVAQAVAALPGAAAPGGVAVEALPTQVYQGADSSREVSVQGTGTRTRITLEVGEEGQVGMHAFRSHRVLPLRSLPLAVARIQELGLLEEPRWRSRYRPGGRIRAVSPSRGEPIVLLDGQVLTAAARPADRPRVEEVVDATGLGLGELRYLLHPGCFWQVHVDAPTVLVDRVVRAALGGSPGGASPGDHTRTPLDPGPAHGQRVLELYSGSGLLTLPLAMLVGSSGQVRSLEGDAQAVRDARRNLRGCRWTQVAAGRVTPRTVSAAGSAFDGGGPDVVVLDPPRQGAGRQVVQAVARTGAGRVVLVACDPAALARDLAVFLRSGYRLEALSALDAFPHTHHLEAVAVLVRN